MIVMKTNNPKILFRLKQFENPFAVPAGIYRAILRKPTYVDHPGEDPHKDIRLLFDIIAGEDGNAQYMAKKVYCMQDGWSEELNKDLEAFYTPLEADQLRRERKEIDLEDLAGRKVDLFISTKKVKGYNVPFSIVERIVRQGTLLPVAEDEDCWFEAA